MGKWMVYSCFTPHENLFFHHALQEEVARHEARQKAKHLVGTPRGTRWRRLKKVIFHREMQWTEEILHQLLTLGKSKMEIMGL